eukprot:m.62789 g.62789  ORF g.62789 m.62789 type:complete len:600 (+) comp9629_c0_seq1:357-2156(+)
MQPMHSNEPTDRGMGGEIVFMAQDENVTETRFSTDGAWGSIAPHSPTTEPGPPSPECGVAAVVTTKRRGGDRREPLTWVLNVAAGTAAIGGFLFGYDIGVISGAILQLRDEFSLSDAEAEAVVSSLLVGAVVASATGGYVCDAMGRRNAIVANAGLFVVSALWLALSTSIAMLIAARVLVGYAVSLSAIAECVYLSEIAPASRRGQLVSLNELGITVGIVSAYAVNVALIDTPSGWRLMFGVAAIPAGIQLVGMTLLPKSPRWLLMRGRQNDAVAALQKFRVCDDSMHELLTPLSEVNDSAEGNNETLSDPIRSEIATILASISAQGETHLLDLLRVPVLRKALWIGCVLVILQQLTGQPSILYYGTVLLRQAGFQTRRQASLANLGIGALKALSTVAAILTVDRLGRRRLLLIGTAVMTLSLLVLAAVLTVYAPPPASWHNATLDVASDDFNVSTEYDAEPMSEEVKWTTVGSLAAYVCAYSFSYGPVVWLLLSETFPDNIRARAIAIATLLNNGANFAVSASFLTLLTAMGIGGLCLLYAAVCVVAAIFISLCVPETKGASLEQVQAILLVGTPPLCEDFLHETRYRVLNTEDVSES